MLILGQKGGYNKIQIMDSLKERPYNLNQLSEILKLNYRTVKHHIESLEKNDIISSSSAGTYGDVYFFTPDMEGIMDVYDDIVQKFNNSKKLSDFTQSLHFFKKVIEQTHDAIIIIDKDGGMFFINDSAKILLELDHADLSENIISFFGDNSLFDDLMNRTLMDGAVSACEMELTTGSKKTVNAELTMDCINDDKNNLIGFSILARDITNRKIAENQQNLTIDILRSLNKTIEGQGVIREILTRVKSFTDLDAVAIRLNDGIDYPYFVYDGFPEHFIQSESHLCARDENGDIQYTSDGKPVLECMCGTVLSSKTDPTKPYFTHNGSFWTNCTTELIKITTDDERGSHTRNVCNREGYESVALIPLQADDHIIGLLQLNDKKTNRFTEDNIKFFEEIGSSIGIAFSRMKMEELLNAE
jgi:PAS domain S-box-containing protein